MMLNAEMTSLVAAIAGLAPSILAVVVAVVASSKTIQAVRRFKVEFGKNDISERDLDVVLDILRKMESEGRISDTNLIIAEVLKQKDRNPIASAFSHLDQQAQSSIASVISDPSDTVRRRFLSHAIASK